MFAFCLKNGSIKKFMNEFLKGETFDDFVVRHMEVFSVADFTTDGRINPDHLKDGENRRYCLWKEIKPVAYFLIKGNIKPRIFKTVLALSRDKAESLNENAASMHMTVTFENDRVVFLTGTSQKNFSLNKETDMAWDGYIKNFFTEKGYDLETL